jgi:hypothetical protein
VRRAAALGLAAVALAGCGFNVAYPDLFLLTRTGPGGKRTLLVNNSGTASCNRGKSKPISSRQLIVARDLADSLATDAQKNLSLKPPPGSVYSYAIRMQQGTIRFPDTAGGTHKELAQAELFFLQTLQNVCGAG